MSSVEKNLLFLEHKAYVFRKYSLEMTTKAGSGHPTSCLSAADMVAALFFYAMRYDPYHVDDCNNDVFILSKGHASPLLYAAWCEVGVISYKDLMGYRTFASPLEGHPTFRFAYTQAATGSLGMGLALALGFCLDAQHKKSESRTYVLMGDAEVAEGSVWEAAELAAYYNLYNCIALLDCNRLGQSTQTLHGHDIQKYANKFEAFGWNVLIINGHDMQEIVDALDKAHSNDNRPTIIIAKTFKGHGVNLFEDKQGFHGVPCPACELPKALEQLHNNFPEAAAYTAASAWKPKKHNRLVSCTPSFDVRQQTRQPEYAHGQVIATRKAFGQALAALGSVYESIVVLDADVKNSTYTEFFQEAFPDRFFECFIAEQAMVSIGVGLHRCHKIPFIATFASFLSRAHDQIRMAAIGQAALRLVGSHAGVSIGQDGPSQMGLEDIAMMRALPESIVLYPSDAISTYALTHAMVGYNKGISYMRTTRMATPVIYHADEQFEVGGCKVIKQYDQASVCLVAAGVTLHEALKAHDLLHARGIQVAVIDLYSIKPIDTKTLKTVIQASGHKVITIEDHYLQGGLGEAVTYELRNEQFHITCLAVTQLPRSGKPEELLAWAQIDAAAIVKAVEQLL